MNEYILELIMDHPFGFTLYIYLLIYTILFSFRIFYLTFFNLKMGLLEILMWNYNGRTFITTNKFISKICTVYFLF